MKVEYENLGYFTFTAEDGRDEEWLAALARSLNGELSDLVEQWFWFYEGENPVLIGEVGGRLVDSLKVTADGMWDGLELLKRLSKATTKVKRSTRAWIVERSKDDNESKESLTQDVKQWNKLFPDDPISL